MIKYKLSLWGWTSKVILDWALRDYFVLKKIILYQEDQASKRYSVSSLDDQGSVSQLYITILQLITIWSVLLLTGLYQLQLGQDCICLPIRKILFIIWSLSLSNGQNSILQADTINN